MTDHSIGECVLTFRPFPDFSSSLEIVLLILSVMPIVNCNKYKGWDISFRPGVVEGSFLPIVLPK